MSGHVTATIAELHERRDQTEQQLHALDTAIALLQKLDGNGASPAAPPPAAKPSGGRREQAPTRRPADGGTDRDARRSAARAQWEAGDDVKAIAKAAGVTTASIYNWSARGKWKRPKPGAGTAAPAAKGEQLAGRVRCDSCQVMTERDPCEHCGKPLKRGWR